MRDLCRADKASLTKLEKHAREVLRQCEFLRSNGGGDEMRFGWIHLAACDLVVEARRAFRRFAVGQSEGSSSGGV